MINGIQFIIRSRKADLRIQGYLTKITFRLCYFIISLQLTAADILGKRVIGQRFIKHIIIIKQNRRNTFRNHRLQIFILTQCQKRTKLKHTAFQSTLIISQSRTGIQHIQFQLQQIIFTNLPHAALGLRHFMQLLCIFQILPGYIHILFCQQKIEKIINGRSCHILGSTEE